MRHLLMLLALSACADGIIDDDSELAADDRRATGPLTLAPDSGDVVAGSLRPELRLGPSGISQVDLVLRDASGQVVRWASEKLAPYCLMGDGGSSTCNALDSRTLPDGRYRLEAQVSYSDGSIDAAYSTFFVENAPASSASGLGRVFYVSASGNDGYSLTEAQSPGRPWRTAAHVNAIFSQLLPGDSVLFERGGVFQGPLVIKKAGTASKPITLGAYGQGPRPVISGFITVSSWTAVGGGVYRAPCDCGSKLRVVAIDGVPQRLGRWPNVDAGFRTVASHSGQTAITDATLPPSPSWVGGEVVLRPQRWSLDRYRITSQSGTTLGLGAQVTHYGYGSAYTTRDGTGYFIQNHRATLDQPGEWYYDAAGKQLYVVFDASGPAGKRVEAARVDTLVDVAGYGGIRLHGLSLRGASTFGVHFYNAPDSSISRCDITASGGAGVDVGNSPRAQIVDSTLRWANDWGVYFPGGSNGGVVRGNVIADMGTLAGLGDSGANNGIGLRANGADHQLVDNEVVRSGYNAIQVNGDRTLVQHNLVRWFTMVKDDGAGIYTNSRSPAGNGTRVFENLILDGLGAAAGSGQSSSATSGIYVDDGGAYVEIRGNTVARVGLSGLFVHNAYGLTITGNTIFDCGTATLMKHDSTAWPAITDDDLSGNVLFAKLVTQGVLSLSTIDDFEGLGNVGLLDGNVYARPFADEVKIRTQYKGTSGTVATTRDLPGWRLQYGQDLSSRGAPLAVPLTAGATPVSSNALTNGSFATTDLGGAACTSCTAVVRSAGKLDGNYLEITPSGASAAVGFRARAITAGHRYRLRFSLRGSNDQHTTLSVYLRIAGSPYTKLTPEVGRAITTARQEEEIVFVASKSDADARLFFGLDAAAGTSFMLDNLELVEIAEPVVSPDAIFHLESNPGAGSRTVVLPAGSWVDARGGRHSGTLTLGPWSSVVLIRE